jgi:predicted RNA-binding protein Jag
MKTRAGPGGMAAMETAMDDTAQLRVELAVLRARVDALQTDLMDLVALHGQTLEALACLAGTAPRVRQQSGSGA